MKKNQLLIMATFSCLIFILLFLNASRHWLRLDLSKGKAYTLSKVSRELYLELDENIVITYYRSEKLLQIHPAPRQIEDLLREYEAHSHSKIRVVIDDPVKSKSTETAERLRVFPQQMQIVEKDQAGVATVYTGIVIEYLDRTAVIPVAFSLGMLEYDVRSRIRSLLRNSTRIIGVLLASSELIWAKDFAYADRALQSAGFQVRELEPGQEIPSLLSSLIVIGGAESLDDWDLYRLDSFIHLGGKVLFAVEGVKVNSRTDLDVRAIADSPLLEMLQAYGVRVERQLVLDRASLTIPFQTRNANGTTSVRLLRYPHWVSLLKEFADKIHPPTNRFPGIDLFWASPFSAIPVEGLSITVLVGTSPNGWRMTRDFATNPGMEALFYAEEVSNKGGIPMVIAVSGRFRSVFHGKPKPT